MTWNGTIIGITESGTIWQYKLVNALQVYMWVQIIKLGEDKPELS